MLRRTLAMARKEFLQMARDPRSLVGIFLLPGLLLLLFGYAITFDVHHVRLAVCDQDHSRRSRDLVAYLTRTGYFDRVATIDRCAEAGGLLDRGQAQVVLVIPPRFGELLDSGQRPAPLQSLIDGSDNTTANTGLGYLSGFLLNYSTDIALSTVQARLRARLAAGAEAVAQIELAAAEAQAGVGGAAGMTGSTGVAATGASTSAALSTATIEAAAAGEAEMAAGLGGASASGAPWLAQVGGPTQAAPSLAAAAGGVAGAGGLGSTGSLGGAGGIGGAGAMGSAGRGSAATAGLAPTAASIALPETGGQALGSGGAATAALGAGALGAVPSGPEPGLVGTGPSGASAEPGSSPATAGATVAGPGAQLSRLVLSGTAGVRRLMPLDFRPRVWFNPELRSARFLVPGLIGMIAMIVSVIISSLSLVRERERGTMEQLAVSPLRRAELILGKLLPYGVVGFIDICLILAVGALFFDVKVAGSLGLLLALSGLFTAGALALGLLISSIARTQQVAFTISMISTVLPTMILSGFVFPIRNMPLVVQAVTYIVPARYFLVILRGIILKGVGMAELLPEVAALTLYTVVLLTLAALRWRKRID